MESVSIRPAPNSSHPEVCFVTLLLLLLLLTIKSYRVDAEHGRLDAFGKQCGKTPLFADWHNEDNAFRCPRGKIERNEHANTSQSSRMAGGYFAKQGEFPSFVYLTTTDEKRADWLCGGALISADMVMTANHCIPSRFRRILLQAGYVDDSDTRFAQKRYASRVCRLPRYSDPSFASGPLDDLALVLLTEPFVYNSYVQPACLELDQLHRGDAQCLAAGAGSDHTKKPTHRLKVARMKRITCPRESTGVSCYQLSDKRRPGNTCPGDSGSPLYCLNRCASQARQVVVGIHSVGNRCHPSDPQGINGKMDLYKIRTELKKLISSCHKR